MHEKKKKRGYRTKQIKEDTLGDRCFFSLIVKITIAFFLSFVIAFTLGILKNGLIFWN